MRIWKLVTAFVVAFLGMIVAANAAVRIHIDLSTQRMHVTSSSGSYTWPVSTARAGYFTPRGTFSPKSLQPMHYSRKYHMSPMPHSIFFSGGFAIHGTYATGMLGRPASHGCVRLAPGNAAALYHMVRAEGGSISISGSGSRGGARYAHRQSGTRYAAAHGRHSGHALAYAASGRHHRHQSVKSWQSNPLRSLFGD